LQKSKGELSGKLKDAGIERADSLSKGSAFSPVVKAAPPDCTGGGKVWVIQDIESLHTELDRCRTSKPQGLLWISLVTAPGAAGTNCLTLGNANNRTPLTLANPTQGVGYSPTMTLITDGGTSSYNGLITAIQHRMSSNFGFLANYTWSKCSDASDTTSDIATPLYQHTTNAQLDRGGPVHLFGIKTAALVLVLSHWCARWLAR
jgi:hypothetical protein